MTYKQLALPLILKCQRCGRPITSQSKYGPVCSEIVKHEQEIKEAIMLLSSNGYTVIEGKFFEVSNHAN